MATLRRRMGACSIVRTSHGDHIQSYGEGRKTRNQTDSGQRNPDSLKHNELDSTDERLVETVRVPVTEFSPHHVWEGRRNGRQRQRAQEHVVQEVFL